MSSNRMPHLSEDQMLQAVVHENALPLPIQEHLCTCADCRAKKERLARDLAQLGRLAKHYAPLPTRPVSLPEKKFRFHIGGLWHRGAYAGPAAAIVAAALMMVVLWWTVLPKTAPEELGDMLAGETFEDEQFMAEIGMLSENALPTEYLEISGESDQAFDEAFMDFVFPSIETEPLSLGTGKGGLHHVKA